MTYRLAYGFLVILLVSQLVLLLGLRSLPFWQDRLHYAPVPVDGNSFAIAWAERGEPNDANALPFGESEPLHFEFPSAKTRQQLADYALQVLVKAKLPESEAYVMRISGQTGSVMLPLHRQADGTYASTKFIPVSDDTASKYVHGVRVVPLHGEACSMAVERVLP